MYIKMHELVLFKQTVKTVKFFVDETGQLFPVLLKVASFIQADTVTVQEHIQIYQVLLRSYWC